MRTARVAERIVTDVPVDGKTIVLSHAEGFGMGDEVLFQVVVTAWIGTSSKRKGMIRPHSNWNRRSGI